MGLNLWAIDANEINDVGDPLEAVAADTTAAESKAERHFKAQEAFDKLSPAAKTDRRLRALEHVLAAKGFDLDDQVALEKPGERTGSVDPRSLREPQPTTIDVNGASYVR